MLEAAIRESAKALAEGKLVVFPTETVYGVGADASNREALEALSAVKSRTPDKPFTVHIARPDEAPRYAGPLSRLAQRLTRKCWPGPVALVVPDRRALNAENLIAVPEAVYWQGTVGLRCPDHAVGRAILADCGVPVVASSANLAGRPAPRTAQEALADLGGRVDLVIDAGPAAYARPSTVVRLREDDSFEVLREGAVTARRISRMAKTRILFVCSGNMCRSPMAAGLAKKMVADRLGCDPAEIEDRGIQIASVGTGAFEGERASPDALAAMEERSVDIRDHRSRPMTVDALLTADYIWVMTRAHQASVVRLAPEVGGRVALLDPAGYDIPDPIGGTLEEYRSCARQLERALAERMAEML